MRVQSKSNIVYQHINLNERTVFEHSYERRQSPKRNHRKPISFDTGSARVGTERMRFVADIVIEPIRWNAFRSSVGWVFFLLACRLFAFLLHRFVFFLRVMQHNSKPKRQVDRFMTLRRRCRLNFFHISFFGRLIACDEASESSSTSMKWLHFFRFRFYWFIACFMNLLIGHLSPLHIKI